MKQYNSKTNNNTLLNEIILCYFMYIYDNFIKKMNVELIKVYYVVHLFLIIYIFLLLINNYYFYSIKIKLNLYVQIIKIVLNIVILNHKNKI